MKKLIPLFLILLPAVVFSLGGNCGGTGREPIDYGGGGGQGEGSFTYDGTTYPLTQGLINVMRQINGVWELGFMAASSGYDPRTNTGISNDFCIALYSSEEYIA